MDPTSFRSEPYVPTQPLPELTELKDLPSEKIVEILSHVDIRDLGRVAKVSRQFRALAYDNDVWLSVADRCGFDRREFTREDSIRNQFLTKVANAQKFVQTGGFVYEKANSIQEVQRLLFKVKYLKALDTLKFKNKLAESAEIAIAPSSREPHEVFNEAAEFGKWIEINKEAIKSVTDLDCRGIQLTYIPPEIGKLTHLTWLSLATNNILYLPPEMGQLVNLKTLVLVNNKLTGLPNEIRSLKKLESLSLERNQLQSVPAALGELSSLDSLSLGDNLLSSLPNELGQLENLKILDLSNNQLTSLPEGLTRLQRIQYFMFYGNPTPIEELPDSFALLKSRHV